MKFATQYGFPLGGSLLEIEPIEGESTLFRVDIRAFNFLRLPAEQVENRARTYWSGVTIRHDPLNIEVLLEGSFVIRSIQYLQHGPPH